MTPPGNPGNYNTHINIVTMTLKNQIVLVVVVNVYFFQFL